MKFHHPPPPLSHKATRTVVCFGPVPSECWPLSARAGDQPAESVGWRTDEQLLEVGWSVMSWTALSKSTARRKDVCLLCKEDRQQVYMYMYMCYWCSKVIYATILAEPLCDCCKLKCIDWMWIELQNKWVVKFTWLYLVEILHITVLSWRLDHGVKGRSGFIARSHRETKLGGRNSFWPEGNKTLPAFLFMPSQKKIKYFTGKEQDITLEDWLCDIHASTASRPLADEDKEYQKPVLSSGTFEEFR